MEPASQITAYLFAHKSTLEFSTIDQVMKDVKLSVFYSMPPISDDEIRKAVAVDVAGRGERELLAGLFHGLEELGHGRFERRDDPLDALDARLDLRRVCRGLQLERLASEQTVPVE